MTSSTKLCTVLLTFFSILIFGVFFIKDRFEEWDKYPTGTPLNEDSLKFNSVEWNKSREFVEDIRPYMLKDLMTNVLKLGMNTLEIKNLLGEPIPWNSRKKVLYYKLGVFREIESSYLVIELDDKGKLRRSYITDI